MTDVMNMSVGSSSVKKEPKTDPSRLARIRAAHMPKFTRPVMFDTPEAEDPFVWVIATPPPAAVELEASIEVDGAPVAMPRVEVTLPHGA